MQRTKAPRRLALLLLLGFGAAGGFALEVEGFAPDVGGSLAIGGQHAALAQDISALISNPAGLAAVPTEVYFGRLAARVSGPVFDIADALTSDDVMNGFLELLDRNDYKLYAGADVAGPLSLGYVGGGLGFGLFNGTKAVLNAVGASSIGVSLSEEILLTGGYAFRVDLGKGNALDFGLSAKGFARGAITESLGALELVGLLADQSALFNLPFTLTTGIGFDAGLRWNWDEILAAGLVCRDVYSPAMVSTYTTMRDFVDNPADALVGRPTSATIDPDLAVGFCWSPRLRKWERYIDDFCLVVDYSDILGLLETLPRNAILNLSLGFEVKILDILYFRAGVAETLLSMGAGLDLGVSRINLAAFGTERGLEPGARPTYNLLLSFDFSL